jgi:L-asparaginase type I
MRHLRVIYTGGTIGMLATERGYAPAAGAIHRQLAEMPRFHQRDPALRPEILRLPPSVFGPGATYEISEFNPPLDSSNMGVREWVALAEDIAENHDRVDGFVVLHGTDTMAYTASALSFMLENLARPVVLTGSQIPLAHLRNDAIDNLLGALLIAAHHDIAEVTLYFRDRLWRGNRVQKVDAAGFDAFHAGNYPPLAEVGIGLEVFRERVRPRPDAPFRMRPITVPHVAALRLHPGMTPELLEAFLRPPLRGLVLETFGAGNAPDRDPAFSLALRRAQDHGIAVVNVTQCHRGRVSSDYAASRALLDAGVLPGADLTPEAALCKLAWILSTPEDGPPSARIGRDLRGELTA